MASKQRVSCTISRKEGDQSPAGGVFMKRMLAIVFALVFLLPLTVQGQEWSAEQETVWKGTVI